MRGAIAVLVGIAWVSGLGAQGKVPEKRFGIEANLELYPQSNPKDALASVLKAIAKNRIDYLLAQLVDPEWVDMRVKGVSAFFPELVKETSAKLVDDPGVIKELGRFLGEGEWDMGDAAASAKLKDVKNRAVFFRKIDERWFLENRQKPVAESK